MTSSMTPLHSYREYLASTNFHPDPEQEKALYALQETYDEFLKLEHRRGKIWHRGVSKLKLKAPHVVKGVYLWGPVGVGKTWLMDIFFAALPAHKRLRMHFHQFMQHVHQELQSLQGHLNPLKSVAERLAKKTRLICLDEFLVHDIGDAMLLANLLAALFAEGITLVTTANVQPSDLYRKGLQRARFLPAIALILQHLKVIHLDVKQDYRLRPQKPAGTYFYPLDATAEEKLNEHYKYAIASTPTDFHAHASKILVINERTIPVIQHQGKVIWFDFRHLCSVPRSQLDYLEIAKQFTTILISNVPKISSQETHLASYFIKLIDVLYDAHVKIVLSAAAPVTELYTQGELAFEFKRTVSRLLEMQGEDYINDCHQ